MLFGCSPRVPSAAIMARAAGAWAPAAAKSRSAAAAVDWSCGKERWPQAQRRRRRSANSLSGSKLVTASVDCAAWRASRCLTPPRRMAAGLPRAAYQSHGCATKKIYNPKQPQLVFCLDSPFHFPAPIPKNISKFKKTQQAWKLNGLVSAYFGLNLTKSEPT